MICVESVPALREVVQAYRQQSKRIALVPTMGGLHKGHLSLVKTARQYADIVVLSIYVNPLQFGAGEDLKDYPGTQEEDSELCEQSGVDVLFCPETLYPEDGIRVSLHIDELGDCLCGKYRPGHFDGVLTVVNLLFQMVQPDVAVFGEKDYQQLCIIQQMVHDLWIPVKILAASIKRERDGLAMSTRNCYLTSEQRKIAPALYQSLCYIADQVQGGAVSCKELLNGGKDFLKKYGIDPQYMEIRSAIDLQTLHTLEDEPARIFVAAYIGSTRLIDNLALL